MKKYGIEIEESSSRVIEVDANSYEEAQDKVEEMYRNQEVILDYEDYNGVRYEPFPSQRIKDNYKLTIEYDNKNENLKIIDSNNKIQESKCRTKEDFVFLVENYVREYIPMEKVKPLEPVKPKNKEYER